LPQAWRGRGAGHGGANDPDAAARRVALGTILAHGVLPVTLSFLLSRRGKPPVFLLGRFAYTGR